MAAPTAAPMAAPMTAAPVSNPVCEIWYDILLLCLVVVGIDGWARYLCDMSFSHALPSFDSNGHRVSQFLLAILRHAVVPSMKSPNTPSNKQQ
jgi:hypothetical protein